MIDLVQIRTLLVFADSGFLVPGSWFRLYS